jgi:hypothetical protein
MKGLTVPSRWPWRDCVDPFALENEIGIGFWQARSGTMGQPAILVVTVVVNWARASRLADHALTRTPPLFDD